MVTNFSHSTSSFLDTIAGATPTARNKRPNDRQFVVIGEASAQLPLRLLGLFAQQDLLPLCFELRRLETGISVAIVQDELDAERASVMLEKMRRLIDVEHARLV